MSSKLSSASTARKSLHDAALDPTGSSSSSGSDAAPSEEEDEEELENVSQGNGSSRRRYRQRIHFNVEQLQAVYHLPLKTAAERLGVCEAALKRICRRNRIHKWPYRQLSSVRRRIDALERQHRSSSRPQGEDKDSTFVPPTTDRLETSSTQEMTQTLFNTKRKQLHDEEDRIIRSAHAKRRPRTADQHSPGLNSQLETRQLRRPSPGETLTAFLHGHNNSSLAHSPPLNLGRVERDFPLLFLANVCESVRAYK